MRLDYNLLFIFLLLFPLISYSKGEHKKAEITRHRVVVKDNQNESEISFTAESNIFQDILYETVNLEYSSDIEIGLFISNIPVINSGTHNYEYDSYITLTKWFDISKKWKIGIGSQNGTTLFSESKSLHNFTYIQNSYDVLDYLNLNGGTYFVNKALATNSQQFGALLGVNYHIIPKKLWVEYSFLSGNSNVSGSMINTFIKLNNQIDLYFGVQVPAPNSGNEFAGTVGIKLFK